MITWFKMLKRIVKNYDKDRQQFRVDIGAAQNEIRHAVNLIRKNTSIHVDVHHRNEPNNIIILGQYRGRDYINTFHVHSKDMSELVNFMRELQHRYLGRVKYIDAVPAFSAVIKKECDRDLGK